MFGKLFSVIICVGLLASCAGEESVKVTSLQKKDKYLSCKEIMLEVNEAEFYRRTAQKNKNPKIKSLLMPLGYISTYVNAEEAAGAADARIDYLNRVYDILGCDNQQAQAAPMQQQFTPAQAPARYNAPANPYGY